MADFATLAEAEERARAKMADGTWVAAFGCRAANGAPAVRILRPMSASGSTADGMNKAGAWDQTVDAAAT
jgi:hypothetical protein